MSEDLRDIVLSAIEDSLNAQLRAVRRLRKLQKPKAGTGGHRRPSQVDLAYDVLSKAHGPLHLRELLERIRSTFGVAVDRESLVSSLTKKVARGDRFLRTEPNTFGLRPEAR